MAGPFDPLYSNSRLPNHTRQHSWFAASRGWHAQVANAPHQLVTSNRMPRPTDLSHALED